MKWKTHILTAWFLFLPVVLINKYPTNEIAVFGFFLFLGSLMPDLDTSGKIKHSYIFGNLLPLIALISNFILLPTRLMGWQKHREMTHSLLGMVVIGGFWSYLFSLFNLIAAQGIILGYFAHIFSDGLTKSGVPAFFPTEVRLRGFFKTGGWTEILYVAMLIPYSIIIVYFQMQFLTVIIVSSSINLASTIFLNLANLL